MAKYVEFPLEDGGVILVEASDERKAAGGGFVRGAPGDGTQEIIEKAKASFEASFESVRKSADALVQKLTSLSQRPDEVEVSFSLKVSAELGNVVIAKAGSESNYSVTLRWRNEKEEKKAQEGE